MPIISDYEWFVKGKRLGIGKLSTSTGSLTAPGAGSDVRYQGVRLADDFTEGNLTHESEIPSRFHRALIAYVLMTHFEDGGDDKKGVRWERVWGKYLRKGRAVSDGNIKTGPVQLMGHDF